MTTEFFSEKAYLYARWLIFCLLLSLPFTRMVSGLNLVAITLLAWIFLVFHWNRKLIPSSLIYFTVIANFYVVFSFFNIFPRIWTTEFEIGAIPQQALFYYSLLPMFYLFFVFMFYYLHSKDKINQLVINIFLLLLYNKICDVFLNGFDPQFFFSIAGLGNLSALAVLGFGLAIYSVETFKIKLIFMFVFILMSLYSPFSQNIVFALVFLGIFLVPKLSFYTLVSFIAISIGFYAIFISDPMLVRFIDQNLSVRLVLINDAIDGFFASNMIGVGFGTESIRNYYYLFKNPEFFNPDDAGFIHLAVHNSFATMLFRLGIVGFIAFLIFIYEILILVNKMNKNKPIATVFFLCFFIVCFQNPALESYWYMFGVFMMLGSIKALYTVENTVKNSVY